MVEGYNKGLEGYNRGLEGTLVVDPDRGPHPGIRGDSYHNRFLKDFNENKQV